MIPVQEKRTSPNRTVIRPGRSRLGNVQRVTTATTQLWICSSCGWIYDPAEGEDWFCPVCGARKSDFEPYDG